MAESEVQTAATANFRPVGLVVVAGGSGERFGGLKQLADLAGKPLLAHTLMAFDGIPIGERVLVVPGEFLADKTFETEIDAHLRAEWKLVVGGATRAESVLNGCRALSDACEYVLVHDGARPFPPVAAAAKALSRLQSDEGLSSVVVASEVTDTIKRVDKGGISITGTEDRDALRRAETPQASRRKQLIEALTSPSASSASDDASALEMAGFRTAVELHDAPNIKVTHPIDLIIAKALIRYR